MSGQPVKSQSEANKKRNEYMESLELQENINDMNLQANKTYLLSGQLPAQSQMQDTRTTSEKLKDVEGMKQKIAGDFAGIIDASSVYALINMIMSSPLNLNNSLFKFFAQRASSIAEQYKNLYSVGIEGDQNDILRIYEYVKNMYSDTQGKFQSTKSYMNSQYSGSSSKVIGANDLDSVIIQLEDIMKNIKFTSQKGSRTTGLRGMSVQIHNLLINLQRLRSAIPDNAQIEQLMKEYNDPRHILGTDEIYEQFMTLIEKLPKYNEVMALLTKINQYILSNNMTVAYDGINKFIQLFEELNKPESLRLINAFYDRHKARLDNMKEQTKRLLETQTINHIEQQQQQQERDAKAQRVYIVNPESDAVWVRNPGGMNDGVSLGSISENDVFHEPIPRINRSLRSVSSISGDTDSDSYNIFHNPVRLIEDRARSRSNSVPSSESSESMNIFHNPVR